MSGVARDETIRAQREWALAAGLEPDQQNYLKTVEENLFRPLSGSAWEGLMQGSGSELIAKDGERAKFRALHSSSALAVNVFDHFVDDDRTALSQALELESPIASLTFEEKFLTGLRGIPPTLDVVLRLENGEVIGIESKFTEWMQPATEPPTFRQSYFPEGEGLWAGLGLPRCQTFASAIQEKKDEFYYLGVNQLLKHGLGLANQTRGAFRLFYVFFDWAGEESRGHWAEIERFASAVGDELDFRAISYQELYKALTNSTDLDQSFQDYLGKRYFQSQVEESGR